MECGHHPQHLLQAITRYRLALKFVVVRATRELRETRGIREIRGIRGTRELRAIREHQTVRMLSVGALSK